MDVYVFFVQYILETTNNLNFNEMNRQLKFRAWDKLSKQFIYPDKGYQGHYVLDLNGRFQNLQNGSGGNEYVVQQFTGFKDSNGVDVYEGDRIRYNFYYYDEVKWENNSWALLMSLKDFEVVGNVFQLPCNPDHNGECLVCDNWLSDCPFNKNEHQNYEKL
jgi:hypothetical protein